jgi:dTDP-D-glucose 4,6-dehydratase
MGKRVRMINRSGRTKDLPAGVELIASDAFDRQRNVELTRGATTIYQAAQPKYHEWQVKFPPLQQAILDAAIANHSKFVAVENLYIYGDTHGAPMTEETPNRAHTKKGMVRRAMSEALFEQVHQGTVRAAVVRGSDYIGPDDPVYAELFFRPALEGKRVKMLGRLDVPHTWTYAPDFGRALAIVGTRDEAMGQIWHVPSDAPITQQALLDLMSAQVNHPVRGMAASKLMVAALGLFVPTLREMVEMYYEFNQPFVMQSDKFTRTFGVQATALPEAVRATMEWVRGQRATAAAQTPALAVS